MSPLDQWDLAVLDLALDFLGHHTDKELLKARERGNRRKQLSMLVLREQIGTVRTKLRSMVSP